MKSRQRDKLEFVVHFAQLLLKIGDGHVVQLLFPIERRRAVVGEQLPGKLCVDGVGEFSRSARSGVEVSHHKHVRVRRISQPASDSRINPPRKLEEPFRRTLPVNKLPIRGSASDKSKPANSHPCAQSGWWARRKRLRHRAALSFSMNSRNGTTTCRPDGALFRRRS